MTRVVQFMRDLVAKGMSWEDAALFAERMEQGIDDAIARVRPVRSSGAERQARYRERRNNGDVTGDVTPLPQGSKEKVSPTPLSKTQPPNPNPPPLKVPRPKLDLSEFDQWWLAYPRKVARGAAKRAFPKARKLADLGELIAGAQRYAASADPEFTCHPASWLNAERWLDMPEKPPDEPGKRVFDLAGFEEKRRASGGG